jgi:hypothetical protein
MRTFLIALAVLVFTGAASAHANGWTTKLAEAKVKATYVTVDPVRLAPYQEYLDRLLAAGLPESDLQVIRYRSYVAKAKVGARPERVKCAGVGSGSRFSKFHCTAYVTGIAEYTGDFHAAKKLTVKVTAGGFKILTGWR